MSALTCQYVIVNYNAGGLLLPAVQSMIDDLAASKVAETDEPWVVVVDNDSTDGSLGDVRDLPRVKVVEQANLGYAAGANRGIAETSAPIVVICNPDLVIHRGASDAAVQSFIGRDRLGAVGPRILNLDGSTYPSIRLVPKLIDAVGHGLFGMFWKANPFTRRYRQLDRDPNLPCTAEWVSGAAIWLRRSAVAAIGGWDQGYFMYVEDVDLCWRLRSGGFDVWYEPGAQVTHVQGASTRANPEPMLRAHHESLWRFAKKRLIGWRRGLLPLAWLFLKFRTWATIRDSRRPSQRSVISLETGGN